MPKKTITNPLHTPFKTAHAEWWAKFIDLPYVFDGGDAKAINGLINWVKSAVKGKSGVDPTDDEVLNAWKMILDNYEYWGFDMGKAIRPRQIYSRISHIVMSIKDIKSGGSSSKQKVLTTDEMSRLNELIG